MPAASLQARLRLLVWSPLVSAVTVMGSLYHVLKYKKQPPGQGTPLASKVLEPVKSQALHTPESRMRRGQTAPPPSNNKGSPEPDQLQLKYGGVVLFFILYVAYISLYLTRKSFSLAKPLLQSTETGCGFDIHELGWVETAFLGGYLGGQFSAGPVSERFGPALTLAICFIGSGACNLLFGMSPCSFTNMSLLWALNGLCQGMVFPVCAGVLNNWKQNITYWSTSQQLGGLAAGMVCSGPIWRATFNTCGLVGVFMGIFLLVLPSDPSDVVDGAAKASGKKKAGGRSLSLMEKVRLPGLVILGLSYFGVKLVRYAFMLWAPYYLKQSQGFSNETAALAASFFDFAGLFGTISSSFLYDHGPMKGRRIGIVATFVALAAIGTALFVLVDWLPAVVGGILAPVLVAFVGFCVAGPDSVLGAAAIEDACKRNSVSDALIDAAGFANGLGSMGPIFQGKLVSSVVDTYGWTTLFLSFSSIFVLVLAVLTGIVKQENPSSKSKKRR